MLGAYIGDYIGSVYEWNNIKTKNFDLFQPQCRFTDDSVMTCAVANVFRKYVNNEIRKEEIHKELVKEMQRLGNKYPDAGYGGRFSDWLKADNPEPYNSYGNGSAMRVSAAGWYAKTLEEAEELAKISAEVTHNHPEGIKGAQATAAAIFMAKENFTKDEIKKYIEDKYYKLNFTLDEIRPTYSFDVSCQGTVPQAIVAFLESTDFEDAIRNAISLGGDSDTLAAITGSISEAFYVIPFSLKEKAISLLNDELKASVDTSITKKVKKPIRNIVKTDKETPYSFI